MGIATKMFKYIENFSKENDYLFVSLVADINNKVAQNFYESLGYEKHIGYFKMNEARKIEEKNYKNVEFEGDRSKMFNQYADKIKNLKEFSQKDILVSDFRLYRDNKISIFYAPHNEVTNPDAKVFIIGITPGWSQTLIAYKTANKCLNDKLDYETTKYECKKNSRFAGTMRKNIIEMLDELGINKYLNIASSSMLFDECDNLLHMTSVIPYPVFINKKNYTGSNPKITKRDILYSYTEKYFYNEARILNKAFFIPLGKAVDEVLKKMIEEGLVKEKQSLLGFPHPSGANSHRLKQFGINKKT